MTGKLNPGIEKKIWETQIFWRFIDKTYVGTWEKLSVKKKPNSLLKVVVTTLGCSRQIKGRLLACLATEVIVQDWEYPANSVSAYGVPDLCLPLFSRFSHIWNDRWAISSPPIIGISTSL